MIYSLKMHKFPKVYRLFLLCCFSLLIIACNINLSEEDFASVSVAFGYGGKSLLVEKTDGEIDFKYLVVYPSQTNQIDEKDFKNLDVENNSARIGNLKPGSCDIYIYGYINNKKVYQAKESLNVEAGSENKVNIILNKVEESNLCSVVFNIVSTCDQIIIDYHGFQTDEKGQIVISDSQNDVFYTTKDLKEDSYEFNVCLYTDGIKTGGETVACDVKLGQSVFINGNVKEGLSTVGGLDITKAQDVYVKVGEAVNFFFASCGENVSYKWILDDSKVLSTSSFCSFKAQDGIEHILTCQIGDNKYSTKVQPYYHETIVLSYNDLVNTLRDSDKIYKGFSQNGKTVSSLVYSQTVEYSWFDQLSFDDLELLGIQAIVASSTDISTSRILIIPENVSLTVTQSQGWLGQKLEKKGNTKLTTLYSFKNLQEYCLYGCNSLLDVYLLGNANKVDKHALGECAITKKEKVHCDNTIIFDDLAFDS